MTIQLFDLTSASQDVFFSPYCWRIRMALKHKNLEFTSIPWHFTEGARLEEACPGAKRVPLMLDGDSAVVESSTIAAYLDETYPDEPPLMRDKPAIARARFIETWCNTSVFRTLPPLAVMAVFGIIAEKDKTYFRESREKRFGPLEEISKDRREEAQIMNKSLAPAEAALGTTPYLNGDSPDYSDYVLFGTLMWPYIVCKDNPIDMDTNVGNWFDRMLDLNNGYARSAKRAAQL